MNTMGKIMEFPAVIERWVDADTVRVNIDQGFCDWKMNREVRLYDIDAPENRTSNPKEKLMGKYLTGLMEDVFPIGTQVLLISYPQERGKYGRVIGDVAASSAGPYWSTYIKNSGMYIEYGSVPKAERSAVWDDLFDQYGRAHKLELEEGE